jgi:hypothetical protein
MTEIEETKSNSETEKKGFSWLALFFAPAYYAGYGKVGKGVFFAFLSAIPIINFIMYILAGFRARKELPIGQQPFSWGKAISIVFLQILLSIPLILFQLGQKDTVLKCDSTTAQELMSGTMLPHLETSLTEQNPNLDIKKIFQDAKLTLSNTSEVTKGNDKTQCKGTIEISNLVEQDNLTYEVDYSLRYKNNMIYLDVNEYK